ncbi:protein NRT1/ PTR FAMILY 5.4-like [Quillaja saponaria]|uniref:Protein NRT1/ PTR FAMILY 5.4-like n=1 Tax=Quillaja saponaria TaxID=32244 RepID=A0AAD7LN82_QUISA|nr:protein NRT1/ PTR FAMILY 5.4-like [Quillaja saponaria]
MEKMGERLSRLFHAGVDWLWLSKGAMFIWGLLVSHSIVDYACVSILVIFYTDKNALEDELDLMRAAIFVNLQEGLTSISIILLSHISNTYIGDFKTIIISTSAYVIGILMLWSASVDGFLSSKLDLPVYFFAALFLALGKAGRKPPLKDFLDDQLSENNDKSNSQSNQTSPVDQTKLEFRKNIWARSSWICGAIIAIFGFLGAKWENVFVISAILMFSSGLLFCSGFIWYKNKSPTPTGGHLGPFFKVFKAAIWKFRWKYPDSETKFHWKSNPNPKHYQTNNSGQIVLLPRVPFIFNWVDKAAIIEESSSSLSPEQQVMSGKLCTVKEVRVVKQLLTLTYMWVTSLAFGLVLGTGDTLFNKQGDTMKKLQIGKKPVRSSLFFVFKSFVRDIIIYLFWMSKARKQGTTLVRIGFGLFCAVICCIVAWQLEVHRQKDTSVLWIFPQYLLLGLMEGLTLSGMEKFLENSEANSLRNFGQTFSELVAGTGKLLSIPFVLIFSSWIKKFPENSHLDWYFLMLAVLSFVFFSFYVYFAYKHNHSLNHMEELPLEDVELPTVQETSEFSSSGLEIPSGNLRRSNTISQSQSQSRPLLWASPDDENKGLRKWSSAIVNL